MNEPRLPRKGRILHMTPDDLALLVTYGPCEVCGAPRKSVRREREDGITVMGLVCSSDSAHGPDHIGNLP